ncbi:APC family permease [Longispora albida]|uniref:APC family permease n=1 Tax=Longispora albida TaxID=203523 RepID=UPI00037F16E6|nr:APC family permease [Longispora albida]
MSSPPQTSARRPGAAGAARALNAGQLGALILTSLMLSAAAVLTVNAGVIPTGYTATGVVGMPLTIVTVGCVLAVFCVGYLAMAQRMPSAGGMYTFIAAGLGRAPGVGAAWLAVASYMGVQAAAYGLIGSAVTPLLHGWWGISPPWWAVALACWAAVGVLGVRKITLSGRVMAVLCVAELAAVVTTASSNVATAMVQAAPLVEPWAGFSPNRMVVPTLGAAMVVVVLAYAGVEHGVAYAEEARDKAVPKATVVTLLALMVLYAGAAWAMMLPTGPEAFLSRAGELGPDMVATVAGEQLGAGMASAVRVLFASSLFAAMMAFHQTSSRYLLCLGRERVVPAWLGRVGRRSHAPVAASLLQTALIGVVIVAYAIGGWDPVTKLFYVAGTAGSFGVLVLLAATSVAVIAYFARSSRRPGVWTWLIAPTVAAAALAGMVVLAVLNFAAVLGVGPESALGWAVPTALATLAAAGCAWGLMLRATNPDVYARIGRGLRADLPAQLADSPARA